jgi:ribosomal protein S18 acetylase RimI-like enzyme
MSVAVKILKSYAEVEPYVELVRQGADSERDAFGFLPPDAYRQAAELGKLFVCTKENGEFLGHLMFGGVFPHAKVMQIYSVPRYRKLGVAKMLMDELISFTQERSYLDLSAKVASDLSGANNFYGSMGFQVVSTLAGGRTRKRLIYLRVRDLKTPSFFDLMSPAASASIPSLQISGGYNTKTPIYAIDLNVLFDVSKQRVREKEAGLVMKAAFSDDIRLVITEEFVKELVRTTGDFPNDPHLQLARQMNVLPEPKLELIKGIEQNLAEMVFPEKFAQDILSVQDISDIRHLATAIHHDITGFITSEKAILRAHEKFQSIYGIDVLGVSDFADAMATGDDSLLADQAALTKESELFSAPLTEERTKFANTFLSNLHVPPKTIEHSLSSGDSFSPQKHMVVSGVEGIVSFASWSMVQNPRKVANIHLYADESLQDAKTAIDHTLAQICGWASTGSPSRLHLRILPGHPATRKLALAHGFRPEPGQEEHGLALHKIAVGGVIDSNSWGKVVRSLKSLVGVQLPANIPNYVDPSQTIEVITPSGQSESIPLLEIESLLSPTFLLLPGRGGTIVSIKRVFADLLLGTSDQFSLLTPPEAVFLKNRVYYNTPRAAAIMRPGTPILFYESGEGGGRKSIVAIGRAVESHVLTKDQMGDDIKKRGVLDEQGFQYIGLGTAKLATTFDNIMVFRNPVGLKRLREIGCADGANFVTARSVTPSHLQKIIAEGMSHGSA